MNSDFLEQFQRHAEQAGISEFLGQAGFDPGEDPPPDMEEALRWVQNVIDKNLDDMCDKQTPLGLFKSRENTIRNGMKSLTAVIHMTIMNSMRAHGAKAGREFTWPIAISMITLVKFLHAMEREANR